MGKPIVSTDADGLKDILTERARRDASCRAAIAALLADAIVALAQRSRRERARLGAEARITGARYDIERVRARRWSGSTCCCTRPRARRGRAGGAARRTSASSTSGSRRRRERVRARRCRRAGRTGGRTRRARRSGRGSASLATSAVLVVLLAFAISVDFPRAAFGFQSDEATYYSLTHSLARDGDFAFQRQDLVRVWEEFPSGPEGIFLKRGSDVHGIKATGALSVRRTRCSTPDPSQDRLYLRQVVHLSARRGAVRRALRHERLPRAARAAADARASAPPTRSSRARSSPGAGGGLRRRVPLRLGGAGLLRVARAGAVQRLAGRSRPASSGIYKLAAPPLNATAPSRARALPALAGVRLRRRGAARRS